MQRGRDKFKKYERIICILSKIIGVLPKRINKKILSSSIHIRGNKGLLIRYILLKNVAIKCGENVGIHPGVYLYNVDKLILGDNISIHPMCYIECAGGIEIGSNVSIAHGVTIMSTTHEYRQQDLPIKDQGVILEPVEIKENVWIGAKATILGGTVVSSGSIIGAGAVINRNVDTDTIVAGVPGKKIKSRL